MKPWALALALAPALAGAQEPGQAVRGEITAVALQETPRRLTVRLDDGTEVDATLAPRARVRFNAGTWPYRDPAASDLQRGMTVEFKWGTPVASLLVVAVPPGARRGAYEPAAGPSWGGTKGLPVYEAGRELQGRVVAVNVAGGTLTATIEGKDQTFLADPRDLRALAAGTQVVLVTGDDGRLASVRPAKP